MTARRMNHDTVIDWMFENGHPGYANEIHEILATKDETIGEAGRYWQHCTFTQERLAKLDARVAEVKQAAWDRYEDWATD